MQKVRTPYELAFSRSLDQIIDAAFQEAFGCDVAEVVPKRRGKSVGLVRFEGESDFHGLRSSHGLRCTQALFVNKNL
jgi:hypothetical protein